MQTANAGSCTKVSHHAIMIHFTIYRGFYLLSLCRYVHSLGTVSVKLNEEGQRHQQISMFSWCSKCQECSKSVSMQKDTWCLSFGKYLEMRFHSHAYKRRHLEIDEYDPMTEHTATCSHSLHRDHVQYFSYNGIVASFTYTPVEVWEINLPSLIVTLKPIKADDAKKYLDESKLFTSSGYELYATIYDRLAQLLSDVQFPMLTGLKNTLNNDQLAFREKATYVSSLLNEPPLHVHNIDDAIFMMKKFLADNLETWIQRLNDVNHQYRALCATAKQESPSPSVSNVSVQQQSEQFENSFVDSSIICTEDLKSEPGTPSTTDSSSNVHPLSFHSKDNESEKSVSTESPVLERESKSSSDKKSVKTILRDLLPNEKVVQQTLNSPIPTNEYFTLSIGCVPVLVHDHDFSSVIAYSLASYDYRKKLDSLSYCDIHRKSFDSAAETDDKDSQSTPPADKDKKPKPAQTHVEVNFVASSSTTQFSCKIYFARDFDSMRMKLLNANDYNEPITEKGQIYQKNLSISDDERTDKIRAFFIRSLSKSVRWEARGGKSGSKFCKTLGKFCYSHFHQLISIIQFNSLSVNR